MSTTLTPPPLPPQPAGPPASPAGPPPAGPRPSSRVIAILAIAAGALLILGAVFTGILTAVRSAAVHTGSLSADAAGVTALDIRVDAADFTVAYGGTEATLDVTSGSGADTWRLERDGDTLVVATNRSWWQGWSWFLSDDERAVLTLPRELADVELAATFDIGAGSVTAEGAFSSLEVDLGAGDVEVSGTAGDVDIEVSAGRVELDLADVRTATGRVSAGDLTGTIDGPLQNLDLEVSAGRIDLTIPASTYAIDSDVSVGSFTHDLRTDPASTHRVTVSVSAGDIVLRAAG